MRNPTFLFYGTPPPDITSVKGKTIPEVVFVCFAMLSVILCGTFNRFAVHEDETEKRFTVIFVVSWYVLSTRHVRQWFPGQPQGVEESCADICSLLWSLFKKPLPQANLAQFVLLHPFEALKGSPSQKCQTAGKIGGFFFITQGFRDWSGTATATYGGVISYVFDGTEDST